MKKYLLTAVMAICLVNAQSQNITLLGHLTYSTTCAGVWHYVDSLNNEYALVGADDRISIVDVTTPSTPVEVFNVPAQSGENSEWRELKTFGKYAYAVSQGGGGVIIINLSYLPDSVTYKHWYGDSILSGQLNKAHTIAATDGYIYVFGSNLAGGGAIIANLNDPWNPHFVGQYSTNYIHDGYIRNNILWAGEIYKGQFSVIDVSDKANPKLVTTIPTPGVFCHNTWLSDNSNYLFTTDEKTNAPLGCFNVSDTSNIQMVTTYKCDSLPQREVHNTRVLNDFLINPSYGSHLTIVDAARPDNLIEIANASTVLNTSQSYLCWDASPYLPSGNILTTDDAGELMIFKPVYNRACYLEGFVTDSITGNILNGVKVEIVATPKLTTTNLSGEYKTGIATPGLYDIRFTKAGYITKIYKGTSLASGVLTTINAQLHPFSVTGTVTSQTSLLPIPNAEVSISNGISYFNATCDANGNFILNNIDYDTNTVSAGHWGYITQCNRILVDGSAPLNIQLADGYMDDFAVDLHWNIVSTCSGGAWIRGIPIGTAYSSGFANPPVDVAGDCSDFCFQTGNNGGNANTDDVDNGYTILTSPSFDLTGYINPSVNYSRWFFINPSVPVKNSDTLFISLDNGITSVILEMPTLNTPGNGTWVDTSFIISDYITPTANMTFSLNASDKTGSGNVLEAGLDNWFISNGTAGVTEAMSKKRMFSVMPNPSSNAIMVSIPAEAMTSRTTISLADITGKVIYSTFLSSAKSYIELPGNIASGIYILIAGNTSYALPPLKIVRQ